MFGFLLEQKILKALRATYHGSLIQITIWTDSEFDKVEQALASLEQKGKVIKENGVWKAVE